MGNGKGVLSMLGDWGVGKGGEQICRGKKEGYRHDCEDEVCFVAD